MEGQNIPDSTALRNHIKISECLCDHNQCCGQYVDSLGLGLIINCCCFCHNVKNNNMVGVDQTPEPPGQPDTTTIAQEGMLYQYE
jgi:hypothetical protein